MTSLYRAIVKLVVDGARPPPGSSSREVRKAGAVLALLGLVLLAGGIGLTALLIGELGLASTELRAWRSLFLFLVFPGFAATTVGSYRLVLGADPAGPHQSALRRIALGVVFGFGALLILAAVLVVAIYAQSQLR